MVTQEVIALAGRSSASQCPRWSTVPVVSSRVAVIISVVAAILAFGAVAIEFTVSHGRADLFWFLAAVLLLMSSYALRRYARSILTECKPWMRNPRGGSSGVVCGQWS